MLACHGAFWLLTYAHKCWLQRLNNIKFLSEEEFAQEHSVMLREYVTRVALSLKFSPSEAKLYVKQTSVEKLLIDSLEHLDELNREHTCRIRDIQKSIEPVDEAILDVYHDEQAQQQPAPRQILLPMSRFFRWS